AGEAFPMGLQVSLATAGLQFQLYRFGDHFGQGDAYLEHRRRLADEAALAQAVLELRFSARQLIENARAFVLQHRAAAVEVALGLGQRTSRQTNGHAALQSEKGRSHLAQIGSGILTQQPVTIESHLAYN